MNIKKKLIIFDLDGVLIDSKKNMEASWICVQNKFNLNIPFEEYKKHLEKIFENSSYMIDPIAPIASI